MGVSLPPIPRYPQILKKGGRDPSELGLFQQSNWDGEFHHGREGESPKINGRRWRYGSTSMKPLWVLEEFFAFAGELADKMKDEILSLSDRRGGTPVIYAR
jgi:hypothetical protein